MSEGKFLLKTISVLMMVFGLIVAIYAVFYMINPEDVKNWTTAMVLLIITCFLELIFGAIGFRSSDDPGRANYFLITGIVAVILAIVSMIMAVSQWTVVSLVLPVFYIIGGTLLRKAAD